MPVSYLSSSLISVGFIIWVHICCSFIISCTSVSLFHLPSMFWLRALWGHGTWVRLKAGSGQGWVCCMLRVFFRKKKMNGWRLSGNPFYNQILHDGWCGVILCTVTAENVTPAERSMTIWELSWAGSLCAYEILFPYDLTMIRFTPCRYFYISCLNPSIYYFCLSKSISL